jgi:hypothetical protein
MNPLQALQSEFQSFLLAGARQIVDRVHASATIDPSRRLGIYYDAYRSRLVDALETDYTALTALLGEAAFREMARAYVEATPSLHRNLRWYGGALPEFLRASNPYAESPWLYELAQFEWTITLAFDAADEPSLNFAQVAALDPALWPGLTFRFHPSLQRLSLRSNAPAIRKAADAEEALPEPASQAEAIQWLLWRKDLTVMFKSLAPEEAWALDRARDGMNFTDLCEGLCQWVDPEEAAGRVAGMLRGWVDDQLITATEATA